MVFSLLDSFHFSVVLSPLFDYLAAYKQREGEQGLGVPDGRETEV